VQPDAITSASSSVRAAIDIRRFPGMRRLAGDYAYDFARLAPFFAGNPADPSTWPAAIARTQSHPRERRRVADALAQQQERRGAPPEARAAAARLADPQTVAVVTGQQAGLFGGPLYTLLKALTALKLAGAVNRDHGVPTVAIFWIESEDHDWAEVSSCAVLDAEMRRQILALGTPPFGAGEGPVASVRLDPAIFAAIETLRFTLPPTEFTDELVARLSEAYRPGVGMADAFGQWLEALLGPLGLVVYDAADPATKPLVRDVFVRELESPGLTTTLAAASGQALVELGYHSQVVPHRDNVALFRLDGVRQPIHFRDDGFVVGDLAVSTKDLLEEARLQPEGFSPNVLLRPIVQDTLFPTICYVAGPNELAYLAQLQPIYEHFGVPQPLMFPRATATLLDSASARFLAKYNLPLETLQPGDEAALNHLLETQLPASVEAALHEATQAIERSMGRLIESVPSIDPTLEDAARSTLGRLQHDLRKLHDKIIHAQKRRDETLRRQYSRTRALAFPDGHPQERMVAFVYFLNRYGPALIDRLHADLPLGPGQHWVMAI